MSIQPWEGSQDTVQEPEQRMLSTVSTAVSTAHPTSTAGRWAHTDSMEGGGAAKVGFGAHLSTRGSLSI